MNCSNCNSPELQSKATEYNGDGEWVELAICQNCKHMFTNIIKTEIVEEINLEERSDSAVVDEDGVTTFY